MSKRGRKGLTYVEGGGHYELWFDGFDDSYLHARFFYMEDINDFLLSKPEHLARYYRVRISKEAL